MAKMASKRLQSEPCQAPALADVDTQGIQGSKIRMLNLGFLGGRILASWAISFSILHLDIKLESQDAEQSIGLWTSKIQPTNGLRLKSFCLVGALSVHRWEFKWHLTSKPALSPLLTFLIFCWPLACPHAQALPKFNEKKRLKKWWASDGSQTSRAN